MYHRLFVGHGFGQFCNLSKVLLAFGGPLADWFGLGCASWLKVTMRAMRHVLEAREHLHLAAITEEGVDARIELGQHCGALIRGCCAFHCRPPCLLAAPASIASTKRIAVR